MASLLPELNQKGKIALSKAMDQSREYGSPTYSEIDAYRELFDLDCYPITWEQLVNHLYSDLEPVREDESEIVFSVRISEFDYDTVIINKDNSNIEYILFWQNRNPIIKIGEIQGWWKYQPQTY